mgnify:CR=1 FL=1
MATQEQLIASIKNLRSQLAQANRKLDLSASNTGTPNKAWYQQTARAFASSSDEIKNARAKTGGNYSNWVKGGLGVGGFLGGLYWYLKTRG